MKMSGRVLGWWALGLLSAAFLALALVSAAVAAPPAGPPYPAPQPGQYVYDYAGIFSAATEQTVQDMIVAINQRTSAGIVVYTQVQAGRHHRRDGAGCQ